MYNRGDEIVAVNLFTLYSCQIGTYILMPSLLPYSGDIELIIVYISLIKVNFVQIMTDVSSSLTFD